MKKLLVAALLLGSGSSFAAAPWFYRCELKRTYDAQSHMLRTPEEVRVFKPTYKDEYQWKFIGKELNIATSFICTGYSWRSELCNAVVDDEGKVVSCELQNVGKVATTN